MPVQVQPFDFGNTLKQQQNERRRIDLHELALGQDERRLQAREREVQNQQQSLSTQERTTVAQALPQAIGEAIHMARNAPEGTRVQMFQSAILPIAQKAEELQIVEPGFAGRFGSLTEEDLFLPQADDFTQLVQGFSPEDQEKARRIKAGLDPRAVGNANTTIASGNAGATAEQVADVAGTVNAGKEAGKDAIAASKDAAEQLKNVRSSLPVFDELIQAIDSGASSGALASRLPSVRTASILLENARSRLGLNIVGATTFGALSKGELDLALDTAVPTGLQPEQLKQWAVAKKTAQEKMADELERAAIFLGTPGNTRADYLKILRDNGGLIRPEDNQTFEDGTTVEFLDD